MNAYMYASGNADPGQGSEYWEGDLSLPSTLAACHNPSYDLIYSNGWMMVCRAGLKIT